MCNNLESWRVWGKVSYSSRSPTIAAGYFSHVRWGRSRVSTRKLKKLARGSRGLHDSKVTDGETSGRADRSSLDAFLMVKEKPKADPILEVIDKAPSVALLTEARKAVQALIFKKPQLWASDPASKGKSVQEVADEKVVQVQTSWERDYLALSKKRELLAADVEEARRCCICVTEDFGEESHMCLQCPTHWRDRGRPSRPGVGIELYLVCPFDKYRAGSHCPVCCPEKEWVYDPGWKEFAKRKPMKVTGPDRKWKTSVTRELQPRANLPNARFRR